MRPIHLAKLDKVRPALVLTREAIRPYLNTVTVAPITSSMRGLRTELSVGPANGLDHESIVSCDNIRTIPVNDLGEQIGYLLSSQEPALAEALAAAFDLED